MQKNNARFRPLVKYFYVRHLRHQSTFRDATQMTPGKIVFDRDMILHVLHDENVANWEHMHLRKQNKIDYNNTL